MADELERRRELRRRRILENSENRLRRIENIENVTFQGEGEELPVQFKQNHISLPPCEFPKNVSIKQTPVTLPSSTNEDIIAELKSQDEEDSVSQLQFKETEERLVDLRDLLIVILAVLMRFMCLVNEQFSQFLPSEYLTNTLNKIFLPFIAYEIVEFTFFKSPYQQSKILSAILVLTNLNSIDFSIHIKVLQFITKVFRDMMLYFFVFVTVDAGINCFVKTVA